MEFQLYVFTLFLFLFFIIRKKIEILKISNKVDILVITLILILIFTVPIFSSPWGNGAVYKFFLIANILLPI